MSLLIGEHTCEKSLHYLLKRKIIYLTQTQVETHLWLNCKEVLAV